MGLFKFLVIAGAAWGGYKYVIQPRLSPEHPLAGSPSTSSQLSADEQQALAKLGIPVDGAVVIGRSTTIVDTEAAHSDPKIPFVRMPTPQGRSSAGVVVFAPANCSKAEGLRADDMVRRLEKRGIPVARASSANFNTDGMTPNDIHNMNSVMAGGALPAVFVNGTGKANPSFEEVAAQYERSRM